MGVVGSSPTEATLYDETTRGNYLETVLWMIGGVVIVAVLISFVIASVIFYKAYKATKKIHARVNREFDNTWRSSVETTRSYRTPARPVARSVSPPARSSRTTSSSSSRRSSSDSDNGFLFGATAASFFSSSDSGSSYSSSSDSSSSSSSSGGGGGGCD